MQGKNVAVVITCYNYAKYISRAICSCQNQTFPVAEIIVVNDGSTDDSNSIIRSFARDDHRILYIEQTNQGQAKAKNVGIAASKAEFVAFLDADDWWESDKLARQMQLFVDPQVGVVYSKASYVDAEDCALDYTLNVETLIPRRGIVTDALYIDNFVPFSSSVVRRMCLDQFGVFDETLRMGIDWDLWLRISTAWSFDFVDAPLLVYRLGHPGQMSKNVEERMRCSDRIMETFLERYPNSVSLLARRRAVAFTMNNRGAYYARIDRWKALSYYLRSIKMWPRQLNAIKGICRLLLGQ